MNRRAFLAGGAAAVIGGVAGCLGGSKYATKTFDGTAVPLAPIDDVYGWYKDDDAKFADARGASQYKRAHITGAVLSTAPPHTPADDPVADWSKDQRIVTYCACPHHLSGLRAAKLIDNGYEEVYALDEGFQAWLDNGYPVEGTAVSANRTTYEIRGNADPAYAGQMVRLEQVDAQRHEAAPIADDGSYTLQLHYAGSTDDRFRVVAPEYTVEGTLEELTSKTLAA